VDFLSHLPSFEFYGFQSLERGQLEIKTKYICIYCICASNWVGTDRRRRCCQEVSARHFSRALVNDMGLQPAASQVVLYGPRPHLYTVHRGCCKHDTTI
jgi:hypothetical protein